MLLSIARDGHEIGEWSEEEVRRLFQEGQLVGTDLYWREGMTDWQPLRDLMKPAVPASFTAQVDDAHVPGAPAVLPPLPVSGSPLKAGRNWRAESLGCLRLLSGVLFFVVGYGLTKTYLLDDRELMTDVFYGALAGFACGLVPMFIARRKGNPFQRYFLICGAGGAVGGLILAIPLMIACTVYVLTRKPPGGS